MSDSNSLNHPRPEPDFSSLADQVEDPTPAWQLTTTSSAEESYQGPNYSAEAENDRRADRVEAERTATTRNLIIGILLLVGAVYLALYSLILTEDQGRISFLVMTGATFTGLFLLFRAFDRR
jgi:hypothetical protein